MYTTNVSSCSENAHQKREYEKQQSRVIKDDYAFSDISVACCGGVVVPVMEAYRAVSVFFSACCSVLELRLLPTCEGWSRCCSLTAPAWAPTSFLFFFSFLGLGMRRR